MSRARVLCILVTLVAVSPLGATPEDELLQGCRSGNLSKVRLALAAGADILCVDEAGNSPLHLAASSEAVAEWLLDCGADVGARNALGLTPFLLALQTGAWRAADLLLDRGADLFAEGRTGETALSIAVSSGRREAVAFLLERGFPIDYRAKADGATALFRAVARGDLAAAKLLLEAGADPTVPDAAGRSPRDAAVAAGYDVVVASLGLATPSAAQAGR